MGVDAILAITGLVVPGIIDFVKKKFLDKGSDTPEATMSTLATTTPDVLPDYVKASVEYLKAQVEFFNRDVIGAPSQWIVDLRAAIRPLGVIISMSTLIGMVVMAVYDIKIDPSIQGTIDGVRLTCELIVSSWFGTRIAMRT